MAAVLLSDFIGMSSCVRHRELKKGPEGGRLVQGLIILLMFTKSVARYQSLLLLIGARLVMMIRVPEGPANRTACSCN